MRITSLEIENLKSIKRLEHTRLEKINVLIGPNNSGKSTILKALYQMQAGTTSQAGDVRLGQPFARVIIGLEQIQSLRPWDVNIDNGTLIITTTGSSSLTLDFSSAGSKVKVPLIAGRDPGHFVVPYLSKRKVAAYVEDVREQHAMEITSSFQYLAAKLSRLGMSTFPGHDRYVKACEAILGFVVTAVPGSGGLRPGIYLSDRKTIPIDQMGDGVPNVIGMLADLVLSEGKLFLVEEPENDLHPQALKALLQQILESAESNQFVVSTHSNIVARYLCANPNSALFKVTAIKGAMPPESVVERVISTPEARLSVLRELGYDLADFELWDGWLILEESSAERIIRDYLIPWFAPKLARLRLVSAGGTSQVEPVFIDFNRLVRFAHLEPVYREVTWIRVDGDPTGQEVVTRLQNSFKTWPADRFGHFRQEQFEYYYPATFTEKVLSTLAMSNGKPKQEAKHLLLAEVRAWLDADEERGRAALELSAAEVIADLHAIESTLMARTRS